MVVDEKIRCPICKGELIIGNPLSCSHCNLIFPVKNGIPIMLPDINNDVKEQDVALEKEFYEKMFTNLKGLDDGHCIVYGHEHVYQIMQTIERGSLLEAGCGGGHHSVNLSKMGFDVTAIDLSLNALFAAQKLSNHENRDISFVLGDIKRLPFEDNEFDICLCSLVLHHFKTLRNVIKELTRVTRKYFIAFEVNALDILSFFRFNILNPLFGISTISKNQRAVFPAKLSNILRELGWTHMSIKYTDIHDYIGKTPYSVNAKIIRLYQKLMRPFPERYANNKFLIFSSKV